MCQHLILDWILTNWRCGKDIAGIIMIWEYLYYKHRTLVILHKLLWCPSPLKNEEITFARDAIIFCHSPDRNDQIIPGAVLLKLGV